MTGLACGRKYVLIEYETTASPYRQLRRASMSEVDAKGFEQQLQIVMSRDILWIDD